MTIEWFKQELAPKLMGALAYRNLEYKLKRKHTRWLFLIFYEHKELLPLANYKSKELRF